MDLRWLFRASSALTVVTLSLAAGCASPSSTRRDVGGEAPDAAPPTDAVALIDVAYPDIGIGPIPDAGPSCEERAGYIHVIDRNGTLSRFDPRGPTFTDVGVIDCATSARPFSMSIDRNATAWILFDDHTIRRVSTLDATCTSDPEYTPGSPFELFGMGFTANGASGEDLYVAGGTFLEVMDTGGLTGSARFGRITPSGPSLTAISPDVLGGWPELSGNANGQLFGFFRSSEMFTHITPGRVVELDPATGNALHTYDLSVMGTGDVRAWAFAFWGARFYIFVQGTTAASSDVWRYDPADGSVVELITASGRGIVGAGVSICAPVTLF